MYFKFFGFVKGYVNNKKFEKFVILVSWSYACGRFRGRFHNILIMHSTVNMDLVLTHFYRETLKTLKIVIGKQCRLGSDPHNVASDQGLHCLLTGFSIKNRIKATK